MPPAARLTDFHTCPMQTPGTPPIPHVGGPIIFTCAPTVLIGKLPAARITDKCICVGPLDTIIQASATVFICGKNAARIGDKTTHGGVIVKGEITVLIGDKSGTATIGPSGAANAPDKPCRKEAAKGGKPFIKA